MIRLFVALTTLLLLLTPAPASADGIPLDRLTITGHVQGKHGGVVAGARVYVNGEDYETTTDSMGDYELVIPLHELGNFKSKTKIRIKAKDGRTVYHTTTRQATLALDIKRESRKGKEHCEIRGNEGRLVRRVGEAINLGEPELRVEGIHFVHPVRAARRLTMKAKSVVIMGQKKALPASATMSPTPAVGSAAATGAGVGAAAAPSAPSTAEPRPASVTPASGGSAQVRRVGSDEPIGTPAPAKDGAVKLPGPGVTQTDASVIRRLPPAATTATGAVGARALADVLPSEGGCECRIRGTVELHPDHLLTERLQVFVSLAQSSAVRDTVELFMGSPRPFELRALRCDNWYLNVEAVSKRDFEVVSVDGSRPVSCTQGGLQQLRIVLAPR